MGVCDLNLEELEQEMFYVFYRMSFGRVLPCYLTSSGCIVTNPYFGDTPKAFFTKKDAMKVIDRRNLRAYGAVHEISETLEVGCFAVMKPDQVRVALMMEKINQ